MIDALFYYSYLYIKIQIKFQVRNYYNLFYFNKMQDRFEKEVVLPADLKSP